MRSMIEPDTPADVLALLALSIHNMLGRMPVAIKTKGTPGVLVAGGRVMDAAYESAALDSVFSGEPVKKVRSDSDWYAGMPMFASTIPDNRGHPVAAIGVIDTSGALSLKEYSEISESLDRQVNDNGRSAK